MQDGSFSFLTPEERGKKYSTNFQTTYSRKKGYICWKIDFKNKQK